MEYQRKKMYRQIEEREAAKRREEAKKEIERQILEAIVMTMEQGVGTVADAAADYIINSINAAVSGGSGAGKALSNKSFSAELGVILGKALGQAPFKLLDEIFKDEDSRR